MGLLDDLNSSIPSYYSDNAIEECKEIMNKCQSYWDEIRAAQVEVLSFKALYLHAVESLDYALKQFGNAADKLENKIGDKNRYSSLNDLKKTLEELTALSNSLSSKAEEFAEIDRKITAYSKEITEINKRARDTMHSAEDYIKQKYTPVVFFIPGGGGGY